MEQNEILQSYDDCMGQAEKLVSQLEELMGNFEKLPAIDWWYDFEKNQRTPATPVFQRITKLHKAVDRTISCAASSFSRKQTRSDYLMYLLDVASCELSAYEALEKTARVCAGMNSRGGAAIAEALAQNPAVDEHILLTLCESKCCELWLIVAKSPRAGKLVFARLARLCMESSFERGRKDCYRKEIAKMIADSEFLDKPMLLDLACSDSCDAWRQVAFSTLADEAILTVLSEKCAKYDRCDWEVISTIMGITEHKNSDDDVIYPLCKSRFSEVWKIAAKSPRAGKRTLPKLARKCADFTGRLDDHVREAVIAIINHPNSTPEIRSIIENAKRQRLEKSR